MILMLWDWLRCWWLGHDPVNVGDPTNLHSQSLWFNTVCRRCGRSPLWGGWHYVTMRRD